MTSSEYLALKNRYENIRYSIQNAIGYFDGCSSSILESSSVLKELIIDGKSFDDGKLDKENSRLSNAKKYLESIVSECNNMINYYQTLYNQAIIKEKETATTNS